MADRKAGRAGRWSTVPVAVAAVVGMAVAPILSAVGTAAPAAAAGAPKLVVSPTAVGGGATVSVTATGLGGTAATVAECSGNTATPAPAQCSAPTVTVAVSGGSIATSFEVTAGPVGNGTCGTSTSDQYCEVQLTTNNGGTTPVVNTIDTFIQFLQPVGSVAPSKGVLAGQPVSVAFGGFAGASIGFIECNANITSGQSVAQACDPGTALNGLVPRHILPAVTFPTSLIRTGTIGDGSCLGGDTCYLDIRSFAADGTTVVQSVLAPFTLAQPSATITPSTGLLKGSTVTVAGKAFDPGVPIALYECNPQVTAVGAPTACIDDPQSVTPGSDGSFVATFTVSTGTVGNGTCGTGAADATCDLVVVPFDRPSLYETISFGQPSATVTPSSNLYDGAPLAVKGAGFPGATATVTECAPDLPTTGPAQACLRPRPPCPWPPGGRSPPS
jgi:hypothetical protein